MRRRLVAHLYVTVNLEIFMLPPISSLCIQSNSGAQVLS